MIQLVFNLSIRLGLERGRLFIHLPYSHVLTSYAVVGEVSCHAKMTLAPVLTRAWNLNRLRHEALLSGTERLHGRCPRLATTDSCRRVSFILLWPRQVFDSKYVLWSSRQECRSVGTILRHRSSVNVFDKIVCAWPNVSILSSLSRLWEPISSRVEALVLLDAGRLVERCGFLLDWVSSWASKTSEVLLAYEVNFSFVFITCLALLSSELFREIFKVKSASIFVKLVLKLVHVFNLLCLDCFDLVLVMTRARLVNKITRDRVSAGRSFLRSPASRGILFLCQFLSWVIVAWT